MFKELLQEIVTLSRQDKPQDATTTLSPNGTGYLYRVNPTSNGRQLGEIVQPPRPAKLDVNTLTGFLDAVEILKVTPDEYAIHVEDYETVSLITRATDVFGVRDKLIVAEHEPLTAFTFDQFYTDPQRFIISLQAGFLQTENIDYLIKLASSLKAGNTVQTQDDGFSQVATVRTGEVSSAEVKIPPRIKLIPLRTFPEVEEKDGPAAIESEFLVRLRQTSEGSPAIALFDVDGGRWKGLTQRAIKAWLEKKIADKKIDLPILA